MKVGIVTVHDSSNLGSFLQALGMQELVKQHGDEPYIIKTRSEFTTLCLYLGYNNSKGARSLKSFLGFMLRIIKNPSEHIKRYRKYKTYKKDWAKFEHIVPAKKVKSLNLDAILLGSDEIWNVNQPAFQNPYMYGINLKADKKIAYAISVGNADAQQMKKHPDLIDGISKLNAVIYRDERTNEVMQALSLKHDERICDPTLQVDIRSYMYCDTQSPALKDDYMVVYTYAMDEERKQMIERFAKEHNLKTVAVSLFQNWCDDYVNCSPLEFGAILKNAKYVYTSTFHGTIFSSLYHTKFVSLGATPKVKDVLALLKLEDHILPDDADYEMFSSMLLRDYDFSSMEETISSLRSQAFETYNRYVK